MKPWLLSLILTLPFQLPWICHYLLPDNPDLTPTGFIQYDQPYYMANAREHFDEGFHLAYGNAAANTYDARRIYFQPQTLVLGVLQKVTKLPPGLLFCLFGFLIGVCCLRMALALLDSLAGTAPGIWVKIAFAWGGGLLCLGGLFVVLRGGGNANWGDLFRYDPAEGWWMLNLGRNLVYPLEAWYHLLMLALLWFGAKQRWMGFLVSLALISASHPFTGTTATCFALGWFCFELLSGKGRSMPLWVGAGCAALLACHLGYYLFFLGSDPMHKEMAAGWRLNWPVPGRTLLFGNALVGIGALFSLGSSVSFRNWWNRPSNRMLLALATTVLLLDKHNLLIQPPYQAIHFDHGYLWIALFLMALPWMTRVSRRISLRAPSVAGSLLVFFCADNALWLGMKGIPAARSYFYLTKSEEALLAELPTLPDLHAVVMPPSEHVGYLITVHTPLRSWVGHAHITPNMKSRLKEAESWWNDGVLNLPPCSAPLYVVAPVAKSDKIMKASHFVGGKSIRLVKIRKGAAYEIWKVLP